MDTLLVHYLFGTFPAACLNQSVPLRCLRALHIEQGFADPLQNCLRLQRVIRLPITEDLR